MARNFEKVDKAFQFFSNVRRADRNFSLDDLQKATGWGASTIRTYSTKRWDGFLERNAGKYSVNARFDNFNLTTFRKHHSQKEIINKDFYHLLVEKAVNACISAIELYNKPNFSFREESFSILMINAWELVLKAKILQESNDNLESIQIINKGKVELSASGNPKTISIGKALNFLQSTGHVKNIVADSVRLLIEIRDEAVHFVHKDRMLATKIQAIGTASLKNFMTLTADWFGYDFQQFNFYLMPLSFYNQLEVEGVSLDNQPIKNLLNHLRAIEKEYEAEEDPKFSVALKLETKFVKSKSDDAILFRITDDPTAPEIMVSEEDALKDYPYTYYDLCALLKKRYSDFKRNEYFYGLLRDFKSQGEKFAKERYLDPKNPKTPRKTWFHNRILEEFDKFYDKL